MGQLLAAVPAFFASGATAAGAGATGAATAGTTLGAAGTAASAAGLSAELIATPATLAAGAANIAPASSFLGGLGAAAKASLPTLLTGGATALAGQALAGKSPQAPQPPRPPSLGAGLFQAPSLFSSSEGTANGTFLTGKNAISGQKSGKTLLGA